MKHVNLRPPVRCKKHQLRFWYRVVAETIPTSYKTRPAISVSVLRLPAILGRLYRANWDDATRLRWNVNYGKKII